MMYVHSDEGLQFQTSVQKLILLRCKTYLFVKLLMYAQAITYQKVTTYY